MVVCYIQEYQVLKRFAQVNQIPANNVLITSGIFAFSYSIRTAIDFVQISSDCLMTLQTVSCED
jgi:hypothetical protein